MWYWRIKSLFVITISWKCCTDPYIDKQKEKNLNTKSDRTRNQFLWGLRCNKAFCLEEMNLYLLDNQYQIMDLIYCQWFNVTINALLIEYHILDSYIRDESLIYLRWVGVVCVLASQMSLCGLLIRSYDNWNLNHLLLVKQYHVMVW